MDFVCQAGWAARGIAADICYGRERRPHCADTLCGFSYTDRTLTYCLCEGDGCAGTGVPSLSCWLGLSDRRLADCLRSPHAVLDLSASGLHDRVVHAKPV